MTNGVPFQTQTILHLIFTQLAQRDVEYMAFSTVTFSTVTWICDARMAKVIGEILRVLHDRFGADYQPVWPSENLSCEAA